MANTAAASPAPAAAKATKAKKAVPKPLHPTYGIMIAAAIEALKERKGSSRQAILKYIVANYKVGDEKKAASRLKFALRKGIASNALNQVKGAGAIGSFKIAKDDDKPVTKAAKKPAGKKAAKKPAAKKIAKKPAAKKIAKKPAVKKVAKSPAAKKVAKKPAAKKVAKK